MCVHKFVDDRIIKSFIFCGMCITLIHMEFTITCLCTILVNKFFQGRTLLEKKTLTKQIQTTENRYIRFCQKLGNTTQIGRRIWNNLTSELKSINTSKHKLKDKFLENLKKKIIHIYIRPPTDAPF